MRSLVLVLVAALGLLAACASSSDPAPGPDDPGDVTDGGDVPDAGELPDGGATDGGDPDAGTPPECEVDEDCALGKLCQGQACVPGCSQTRGCPGDGTCCAGSCRDLQSDPGACGDCDTACPDQAGSTFACMAAVCTLVTCTDGYEDCNQLAADGCEHPGACTCVPGMTQSCYEGPPGTQGVGPCRSGTRTCGVAGTGYGPCLGQVVPAVDVCGNNLDEDCDGTPDDSVDDDGDGWSVCDGDCCDTAGGCADPLAVNPGAFDFSGNGVDEDCDGTADNALASCDGSLASNSADVLDHARAMGLCVMTTQSAPRPTRTWGVLSARASLSSGTGTPAAVSRAIRPSFGSGLVPLSGSALSVLSTGHAAAPGQTNPAFVAFQNGANLGTTSTPPADWYAANNNQIPNAPGCPSPSGTVTYDSSSLELTLRVPTNARAFEVSAFLLSSEFPEYVCSTFNDQFLVLLDSQFTPSGMEKPNPSDKNIAVHTTATSAVYPMNVNLASGNSGLFQACVNGPTGCSSGVAGSISTCTGTSALAGTGFETLTGGGCSVNDMVGGGTGWLTLRGNVIPGETATLRFVLWDTSDALYDSVVVLDNFTWLAAPVMTGP